MKDLIYIPHQDRWNEHFPNPGSNKKDYTPYPTETKKQKEMNNIPIPQVHPPKTQR